jgi:tetratricopeptide (TPR) repeat protein
MNPPSNLAAFALLVLLVGLAYGNSLGNGFTMDDDFIIAGNPQITGLQHVPRIFATDYWAREGSSDAAAPRTSSLYRPLVILTYAVNFALAGLTPWTFRLVNILLHLLVSWLIFLLALRIGVPRAGAAVGAALFAVHPIHTEAVTSIVGRAELLMAAGMLAGLWLAACGRRRLSLVAFATGLLSKEQAAMLPVAVLLYDLCLGRAPSSKHILTRYGGYAAVLGGYLLVRGLVLGGLAPVPIPFIDNPLAHLDAGARVLGALKVAGKYLWLCVWPASLSADYSYNAIPLPPSVLDPALLFGLVAWGGLVVWMIRSFRTGDRRAAFCIAFTLLVYLPASNVVIPIGTIMGERLFYLPSAGLCLLAGLAYDGVGCRVSGVGAQRSLFILQPSALFVLRSLLIVICLALTARTALRNRDWINNDTLWRSAARVVPASAKMQHYVGRAAQAGGDWEEALRRYQEAIRIYPGYTRTDPALNINLGDVYFKLGKLRDATEALERAIVLAPASSSAHYNLGLVYARLGRYQEAEAPIRKALALKPEFPEASNALGRVLLEMGRAEEAISELDAALLQRPQFPEAHFNRGLALQTLGRREEAGVEFRFAQEQRRAAP